MACAAGLARARAMGRPAGSGAGLRTVHSGLDGRVGDHDVRARSPYRTAPGAAVHVDGQRIHARPDRHQREWAPGAVGAVERHAVPRRWRGVRGAAGPPDAGRGTDRGHRLPAVRAGRRRRAGAGPGRGRQAGLSRRGRVAVVRACRAPGHVHVSGGRRRVPRPRLTRRGVAGAPAARAAGRARRSRPAGTHRRVRGARSPDRPRPGRPHLADGRGRGRACRTRRHGRTASPASGPTWFPRSPSREP